MPYRVVIRYLVLPVLIILLTACATAPEHVSDQPPDWLQRLQHNRQISDWAIKGKLGVQTATEGGSFDLFWQQRDASYEIRLIAPLGQGAVYIQGNADGVTIRTHDGREEFAEDADALFISMTGLSLPVTGMQDWLRGTPIQGNSIESISWNEHGQLYKLKQRGWNIEMNRYKPTGKNELPHAFYLGRDDQPELSVRLLVRQWELPAGHAQAQ